MSMLKLNSATEGPKEVGSGLSDVIKNTAKSAFHVLASSGEFAMSGFSKLGEKFGNQNPNIVSSRQAMTQHHLDQGKKHAKQAGTGVVDIAKGAVGATKGAVKTVVHTGAHLVNGLTK